MAENSGIEWTDHTFNPWIGCQKVSPACDNCYAEAWDKRFQGERWGPHATRTRTSAANWRKPLAWQKNAKHFQELHGRRQRVFCASLADVFDNHRSIRPEWRVDLWALIRDTPDLDWLLLTKRPSNFVRIVPARFLLNWPENVWIGTTVENQTEADRRIPELTSIPARIRFLSCEPLLGPIDISRQLQDGQIDWVIAGGESGPGARPMHPDWPRSLRDQCLESRVPFHFKQWGDWHPDAFLSTDTQGRNPPPGMRVGKKAAGRLLDGRTWDDVPESRA